MQMICDARLLQAALEISMIQSRLMSLVESLANVCVGFGLAVLTQRAVLPWFGIAMSLGENAMLGLIFTVVSLVRSYFLRRVFETIARHGNARANER